MMRLVAMMLKLTAMIKTLKATDPRRKTDVQETTAVATKRAERKVVARVQPEEPAAEDEQRRPSHVEKARGVRGKSKRVLRARRMGAELDPPRIASQKIIPRFKLYSLIRYLCILGSGLQSLLHTTLKLELLEQVVVVEEQAVEESEQEREMVGEIVHGKGRTQRMTTQ